MLNNAKYYYLVPRRTNTQVSATVRGGKAGGLKCMCGGWWVMVAVVVVGRSRSCSSWTWTLTVSMHFCTSFQVRNSLPSVSAAERRLIRVSAYLEVVESFNNNNNNNNLNLYSAFQATQGALQVGGTSEGEERIVIKIKYKNKNKGRNKGEGVESRVG